MRMRFAKARLIVAFIALGAWVGYVAYQAMAYGRFPVVSHAQLLVSAVDAIADVQADEQGRPKPTVHVVEVHWPTGKKELAGQDLSVRNLGEAVGFIGPGRYVLPLIADDGGRYFVAGLPRSPGFEHTVFFIYPDIPIVRQQLDAAPKPPAAN
jgi:hypothetical protein